MKLNLERLEADGFVREDIERIQTYCDAAEDAGTFSNEAALVEFTEGPIWVCRTIAEILDKVRSGCWLREGAAVVAGYRKRSTLAKTLHDYIKARAEAEGVGFGLDVQFFQDALARGCGCFFGVEVNGHSMMRDTQEPWPGYFNAWAA